MTDLTPDMQGLVLSLRRPMSGLMGGVDLPPPSDPFDLGKEVAVYRTALPGVLARIPGETLEIFRKAALDQSRLATDRIARRAARRQADLLFENMVARGLKPAGPVRKPEDPDIELLAIRFTLLAFLANLVPDDQLIAANKEATFSWMALPEPGEGTRDQEVLWHALHRESQLYMDVMDGNGTTERFVAKQEGRLH